MKWMGRSGKGKENEKALQSIVKRMEGEKKSHVKTEQYKEDIGFLVMLIETIILSASHDCSQNQQYVETMKELLADERLHWLMEKLDIEICTICYD